MGHHCTAAPRTSRAVHRPREVATGEHRAAPRPSATGTVPAAKVPKPKRRGSILHRAFSLLTRFAALTCAAGAMDDALPASNVRKVIKARLAELGVDAQAADGKPARDVQVNKVGQRQHTRKLLRGGTRPTTLCARRTLSRARGAP